MQVLIITVCDICLKAYVFKPSKHNQIIEKAIALEQTPQNKIRARVFAKIVCDFEIDISPSIFKLERRSKAQNVGNAHGYLSGIFNFRYNFR